MARHKYVQLKQATNGRWYFYAVSANGRKTETSQLYANRKNAREAAVRDVPGVEIRG